MPAFLLSTPDVLSKTTALSWLRSLPKGPPATGICMSRLVQTLVPGVICSLLESQPGQAQRQQGSHRQVSPWRSQLLTSAEGSTDLGAVWGEVHPFLHLKKHPSCKQRLIAKAQLYFWVLPSFCTIFLSERWWGFFQEFLISKWHSSILRL